LLFEFEGSKFLEENVRNLKPSFKFWLIIDTNNILDKYVGLYAYNALDYIAKQHPFPSCIHISKPLFYHYLASYHKMVV